MVINKNEFSKSLKLLNKINVLQENTPEELLAQKQEHGIDIRFTLLTPNGLGYYYLSNHIHFYSHVRKVISPSSSS